MKIFIAVLGAVVFFASPLMSIAATQQASESAEKRLWALSEKLALALPGDGRDVLKILPASSSSVATPAGMEHHAVLPKEIAPSLFASNALVLIGADNCADLASFDLTGSCVSMASLRSRYPNLIVMDDARADNAHATYTFGAQVGDAIVAYSFPTNKLDCMSHVAVTPAKVSKRKLGIQ